MTYSPKSGSDENLVPWNMELGCGERGVDHTQDRV